MNHDARSAWFFTLDKSGFMSTLQKMIFCLAQLYQRVSPRNLRFEILTARFKVVKNYGQSGLWWRLCCFAGSNNHGRQRTDHYRSRQLGTCFGIRVSDFYFMSPSVFASGRRAACGLPRRERRNHTLRHGSKER